MVDASTYRHVGQSLRVKALAAAIVFSAIAGLFIARYPLEAVFLSAIVVLAVLTLNGAFLVNGILFTGIGISLNFPFDTQVSHMGVLSIYLAVGSWALWLARREWTKSILATTLPWIALLVLGGLTLAWSPARFAGFQNLTVLAVFIGFVLLGAELSRESSRFQYTIRKVLIGASLLTSGVYLLGVIVPQIAQLSIGVGARSFALLALAGISCLLAQWRYGSKSSLILAAVIMSVVLISLSRAALVTGLCLVPLARLKLNEFSGWLRSVVWVAIALIAVGLLVTQVDELRNRFFEGDLALEVAGVPINVMGRMDFWQVTIDSFQESPWLGKGAGSAQWLMETSFGEGVSNVHPHNEYLRYLHDYGVFGFSLLIFGLVTLLASTLRSWTIADARQHEDAPTHLAAFLAIVAVIFVMLTDNVLVYVWVMAPAGAIVGASLGRASANQEVQADNDSSS